MEKYTPEQWIIFGEVVQNGKKMRQVAEEQGFSTEFVSQTVAMWRKVFPPQYDSEKAHLCAHVSFGRRKRENMKINSLDAQKDGMDNIDDKIVHKF